MTTVDDVLSRLDKETLSMVRRGREISRERLPTASFGINNILGGGFAVGKQHTVWGNEQSGKSAYMLQTIGINQKLGNVCGYIDAEHSFDPEWAERLGVSTDDLLVSQASTISDVTNLSVQWLNAGVRILVIDSTSALMPKSFFSKTGELKQFDDTGQIGQFAKDLGQMCKTVQSINFNAVVVHISQVRMDLGGFIPGMKPSGGKESGHTDQFRVKLTSSQSAKKAIVGDVQIGNQVMPTVVGRKVTWQVDKNKINGTYATGDYDLYVKGETPGIDYHGELLDTAILHGIVEGGTWIKINGEKMQGRGKAVNYLRKNPEVVAELEAGVRAQSL